MQSFYDGMTLVGSLVIMAAIIILAYYASRWYAGKTKITSSGKYVKIIDRVAVSPGCSMMIVQAGDKFYLVGSGDKTVRLICELSDFHPELSEAHEAQTAFSKLFEGFLNKTGGSKDNGVEK